MPQAPGSPAQKRKRGRPPNASKQHADASHTQNSVRDDGDHDADNADERPRKRGKTTGKRAEAEAPPRRRGRPRVSMNEAVEEQADEEPQPEPSRRGRRRKAEQQVEQQDEPNTQEEEPRRKRGRPSLQTRTKEQSTRRQHGDEDDAAQQPEEPAAKPRKRGRPSLQALSPSQAQNKAPKTGKRRAARAPEEAAQQHQKERKRRGRPSADKSSISQPEIPHASPKRRRRSSQAAAPDEQPPPDSPPSAPQSPPKPYVHVAPHIRRVRQSAITAKWSPLTGSSLSAASSLLHLAHRPILQRLSNTHQRRAHTSAALRLMTHRIARKVTRGLPFPPAAMPATSGPGQADGGRETELDFEAVLDGKSLLESQLEPTVHAVEVLRREKERMERELERDYEMLRGLEAGARAQAREQRSLLKKAHVLAPGAMKPEAHDAQNKKELLFARDETSSSASVFADIEDDELRSLAAQLGGHVDSMRTNLKQTDGILPQLCHSRAALQAVLLRHLDQSQYEHVVLG